MRLLLLSQLKGMWCNRNNGGARAKIGRRFFLERGTFEAVANVLGQVDVPKGARVARRPSKVLGLWRNHARQDTTRQDHGKTWREDIP